MNTDNSWQRCVDFHGHSCPGLAIGFKVVEAARNKLGLKFAKDEELVCVTENDACGVDAVQLLTGCSLGKGNLLYRGRGKMAFTFFKRATGESLRIVFKRKMDRSGDREAMQALILASDPDELFDYKAPGFSLPEGARMFNSVVCEQCAESAVEQMMRIHEGKTVCLDCFQEYSRGW